MDPTEFREAVERAAAALPRNAVAAAVRHHLKKGGALNRAAVRECVELAGSFAEFRENTAPEGGSLPPEGRSPFAELTERQALVAVEEWVRQIRNGLFGATDPPFAASKGGYAEAVAWLEAEDERTRNPPTPEEVARLDEISAQIRALALEASALDGDTRPPAERTALVRYWRPDDTTGFLSVGRGRPALNALVRGAVEIAEATGFSQPGVMGYILCGIPPLLPRLRFSRRRQGRGLPTGGGLLREWLVIEVETFSPSEAELRSILREVRESQPEKPEDEALRRLVKECGGVPDAAPRRFWEGIFARWTDAGLPSASPGALRMRFRRLPTAAREKLRRPAD
ncbi:MAG: hypothetical protein M3409_08230 [Gemmatimonadota bacterium]|nr:hypothetical protein [Gemmatimonadota bacterium]